MRIHKGNEVTLPEPMTYAGRRFVVNRVYRNHDLKLTFLDGEEVGQTIDRFAQDEVIFVKKRMTDEIPTQQFAEKLYTKLQTGVFPTKRDKIKVIRNALESFLATYDFKAHAQLSIRNLNLGEPTV